MLAPLAPYPEPWLPPFVYPRDELEVPPARGRRPDWLRAVFAAAAVAACLALQYFDLGDAYLGSRALGGHLDLRDVGPDLIVMALTWPLLPRVSYRRRDVLMILVPFYGVWVVGLVVWRLSGLPYRDWRPRDDELSRVRLVRGGPLYVLVPGSFAGADDPLLGSQV